jgi:small subunit ribosomal protein S14
MAKKSRIEKNDRRRRTVAKYAKLRAELKETIRKPTTAFEEREAAQKKLRSLPRDANPIRLRNRCKLTGRSRGYYRKFGLGRLALRDRALKGELPGVTKASW